MLSSTDLNIAATEEKCAKAICPHANLCNTITGVLCIKRTNLLIRCFHMQNELIEKVHS